MLIPGGLHHDDDAVMVFDAPARLDGCIMIVSPLAVMEAVAAIRRKVVASHDGGRGSEEARAGADAHAGRVAGRMLKALGNMASRGLLRISVLEDWPPDLLLLLGKVLGHAGRAVHYDKGRALRRRGIGTFDRLRFAHAKDAGALVICTADMALADIKGNDDDFGHIRIQMLGGPLIDLLAGLGRREGMIPGRATGMQGPGLGRCAPLRAPGPRAKPLAVQSPFAARPSGGGVVPAQPLPARPARTPSAGEPGPAHQCILRGARQPLRYSADRSQ